MSEKADETVSNEQRAYRKVREGLVVSDKMDKTVVVAVEDRVKHPLYGKVMTRSQKYHADIEPDVAAAGDLVEIEECRPISKTKSWTVARVVERARPE